MVRIPDGFQWKSGYDFSFRKCNLLPVKKESTGTKLEGLVEIFWNDKAEKYIITGSFDHPDFHHGRGVNKANPIGTKFQILSDEFPANALMEKAKVYKTYRPNAYEVNIQKTSDGNLFDFKFYRIEV